MIVYEETVEVTLHQGLQLLRLTETREERIQRWRVRIAEIMLEFNRCEKEIENENQRAHNQGR